MKAYAKGARYERELLHFLNYKGFSCMRAPSSGGVISPVDIVAIKKGLILGIECKAHAKKPKLDRERLVRLKEWCAKAGALGFLAWYNNKKWLFLRLEDAGLNKYEDDNWIERDTLLNAMGIG